MRSQVVSKKRDCGAYQISFVSPVYLGEMFVEELVRQIRREAEKITGAYEIILVDDGSPDKSWERIQEVCRKDPRVKGMRLSRNFGQNYALTAGLKASQGKYTIVLDCDLQDDPKYITELYKAGQDGFEIVYTRKRERVHRGAKNLLGRLFHKILNMLLADDRLRSISEVGNYSLLHRRVVNAFLELKDCHRHYLAILRWLGFDSTYIDIEHRERPYGESSYTLAKLAREAINGITSQTDKLLYVSVAIGLLIFVLSILGAAYIVTAYFFHGFREGWTSLAVLILASTGVILMSLGITGIYVGKTFEQAKGRPLYVIKDRVNFAESRLPVGEDRQAAAQPIERFGHMIAQATTNRPPRTAGQPVDGVEFAE